MEYALNELFELQMGKTPSRGNTTYWNDGCYDWISISDLSGSEMYIAETKEKITELAVMESGIKPIPKNTVIMSFKLSIGKVAITSKEMFCNEAIMAFLDKRVAELLPQYLYYLLLQKNWESGSNKAVMGKTLNKATLLQTKIKTHDIEEQKKIVDILNKVNYIIQQRKRQLQELDNLTKARFIEMFGEPENNNKAWPVKSLDKLCTVGSSKRVYQSEQSSEGVPFWRISDLVSKIDTGTVDSALFISEIKYTELKRAGLVPVTGDILVTSRGTLGRCYIIQDEDCFYFQDGMISWLSNYSEEITPLYLQYLFTMSGFRKQIDNAQAGSTVAYLSIAMLKKLQVMVPNKALQEQFAAFVAQTDKSKLLKLPCKPSMQQ